ncbi:sensor histidine kinase [Anaerotruncus sp. 1XD22-93]|nr:sensor histidine kinase [Lachnospiraceae bacterium]NBI76460.1 sensor histidine kinase [Lachnospiraceae bacterium]RKJ79970.1 sensor histidine kinase [Anaerotruncus sp. 1XD22-93]
MSKKSNIKITVLFVLSISLIVAAMTTYLLTLYYRHVCFHILGGFCDSMIENNPDSRQAVLELLKTQDFHMTGENILSNKFDNHVISNFGYYPANLGITGTTVLWIAVFGFLAGGILFLFSFWYWYSKSETRIQALTEYLEKINTGVQGLVLESSDDEFSKLQDEIYKTVTELYQTREEALTARNNFAENLSNIAHQLKTPITSISLTVQMAKEYLGDIRTAETPQGHTSMACKMHANIKDIQRQINRLMYLEEALLLLSRIDAGTLALDKKPTDVFTILSLASDNLYELFMQKGVLIDIPEMGVMNINVDLNWTMEAVMNLMKNCMEATGTGTAVHCSYEKNPLYVQIRIWDEGEGFAREDLPHLFERFYRGENTKNTGIGIGLSLSKAIIEMQNGIIRAFNLPNGGACYEVRFYIS